MTEPCVQRHVLAIVANVKQFRRPFYAQLAAVLERRGIELRVAYSAPDSAEQTKQDSTDLPAPLGIKCARLYLAGGRLLLQAIPLAQVVRADLVIIVQSNGYLSNYPLLIASALGLKRVAYWGHGYNHQARQQDFRESVRRRLLRFSDWWFAYTQRTAQHLYEAGVSPSRVTVINNAIDTRAFAAEVASIDAAEAAAVRAELGIPDAAHIGLYCGSLYGHKHIEFLLAAAGRIHAAMPGFVLVIVGSGPDAAAVQRAAADRPWLRYVGAQFGRRKAALFRMADVFLNPGLVGLAILDSFAASLPFITTDIPIHSPEIAYLESGKSGLMLPHDEAVYAEAVVTLLRDAAQLDSMRGYALAASREYTVERMVSNVANGILACLGTSVQQAQPHGEQ